MFFSNHFTFPSFSMHPSVFRAVTARAVKGFCTLVVNADGRWIEGLVQRGQGQIAGFRHAQGVVLQHNAISVNVDDESRQAISFAVNESAGRLAGAFQKAPPAPSSNGSRDAITPPLRIRTWAASECQHPHRNASSGRKVPIAQVLPRSGLYSNHLAVKGTSCPSRDGPAEDPRMTSTQCGVFVFSQMSGGRMHGRKVRAQCRKTVRPRV